MDQHDSPSWPWREDPATRASTAGGTWSSQQAEGEGDSAGSASPPPKTYPSRQCRICLDTVPPTYHPPSENLPSFLQSGSRVTYESSDPSLGHLIRPCRCKGSSRYVHEGCLRLWRHADPSYGRRNFWQCPTCGFQYRLERMKWGRLINNPATQILLTAFILLLAMFLLGFVADPIINLYVDPYDTIATRLTGENDDALGVGRPKTWTEHFVKGLASLGVLSFAKVLLALSPWHWWNLRNSGIIGAGSRRTGGRDRVASISWIVLVIGVATFLWTVYKGVKTWSCRILEKAGQRVMDVQLDDEDDEDGVEPTGPGDDASKKDD